MNSELISAAMKEHGRLLVELQKCDGIIMDIASRIWNAIDNGHKVYVIGNGGSAADAQHIAAEFLGRFVRARRPAPVVALTTDTSTISAIGNDFGFEYVFSRQVEALMGQHDVLLAISTSGNSANIIAAIRAAKAKQACTIGFTGHGGHMAMLCDLCLKIPSAESARVQEMHSLAYHAICDVVDAKLEEREG